MFLLDAGLGITRAFAANTFFTLGQVLFEVPTGVVADAVGRRASYLCGSATLFVGTLVYVLLWQVQGPFWAWAAVSMLLGLGFSFLSGATEAWLVDALGATGYTGTLEAAFARGQVAGGVAMLTGTLAGGLMAQATNLGAPYVLRSLLLALTFVVAWSSMRDLGFAPRKQASLAGHVRRIARSSIDHGLRNPPVRWVMLAAPFGGGVSIYAFYAMQPYLLELYGSADAYAFVGLAGAVVASGQIVGGAVALPLRKAFVRRTSYLLSATAASAFILGLIGLVSTAWAALALLGAWAILFATTTPVRQAFINGLIPSEERATLLSSDNLFSSSGAVVIQPALGQVADARGWAASYLVTAGIQLLALPFVALARRTRAVSDTSSEQGKA